MNGNEKARFAVGQHVWVELRGIADYGYMWKGGVIFHIQNRRIKLLDPFDDDLLTEEMYHTVYVVRWDGSGEHFRFEYPTLNMVPDKDFLAVSGENIEYFIRDVLETYQETVSSFERRGARIEGSRRNRRRRKSRGKR